MAFLSFNLAEDGMWVLQLSHPTVETLSDIFASPEAALNKICRAEGGVFRTIRFNSKLSIEFLITYDLPEGMPWVFHGVEETNRVSIRAPRTMIRMPWEAMATQDASVETVETEDPTLHVRLIDGAGLAFFHFDPTRDENDRFLRNCATIVNTPTCLTSFLERRKEKVEVSVTDFHNREITDEMAVPNLVRYSLSPNLQIHLSNLPTGVEEPCFPKDQNGNCVKGTGNYSLSKEESSIVALIEIVEVFRIPYCPDPDPDPIPVPTPDDIPIPVPTPDDTPVPVPQPL